jgi:hypothetical protein
MNDIGDRRNWILGTATLFMCVVLSAGCTGGQNCQTDMDLVNATIDSRNGGVPKDFPKDVPVYPDIKGVLPSDDIGTRTITGSSKAGADEVVGFYKEETKNNGWTQTEFSTSKNGQRIMAYRKATRNLTVCISPLSKGQTAIILSLYDEEILSALSKEGVVPDDPEARAILDKVAHQYATCKTYQDKGRVKTTFDSRERKYTTEEPFSTAFVRPDQLRFEFKSQFPSSSRWYRHVIHSNSSGTQSWQEDFCFIIENEDSLELALAGFTGISGGSADLIPPLLVNGESSCGRFEGLTNLTLLPEADFNGTVCIRIDGKNKLRDTESLWIGKESLLLLRMDSSHIFKDFQTQETTTYEPEIDCAVNPEELEFNLPGSFAISIAQGWDLVRRVNASQLLIMGSGACFFAAGCAALIKRSRRRSTVGVA